MSFIRKVKSKYQLRKMGIKVKVNAISMPLSVKASKQFYENLQAMINKLCKPYYNTILYNIIQTQGETNDTVHTCHELRVFCQSLEDDSTLFINAERFSSFGTFAVIWYYGNKPAALAVKDLLKRAGYHDIMVKKKEARAHWLYVMPHFDFEKSY